jgi:hypothetical protein
MRRTSLPAFEGQGSVAVKFDFIEPIASGSLSTGDDLLGEGCSSSDIQKLT